MDTIETERLVLRNFRVEDAADLYAYLHEPTASCFFSMALTDLEAAAEDAKARSENDEHIAVCLKETGQMIGDVFAVPEEDTFAIGWNFNPEFGGKGYASEAATALRDHLFTTGNARRLYAYVEDHNGASRRLCERLGMRQEGMFVEFVSFHKDANGEPVYENTAQYALLRKEWSAQAKSSQRP